MNGAEKNKREGAVRLWAGAEGCETALHPVSSFCILLSLIQYQYITMIAFTIEYKHFSINKAPLLNQRCVCVCVYKCIIKSKLEDYT